MAGGLRVVFFGTPAFAVPTLDAILGSQHTVVGVVTQPDRPRGRGQHTSDAPIKTRALAAGVPIFQPTKLKAPETLAALRPTEADIGVVAAYGRLIPPQILEWPRLGLINVHASLLPRHRGAAPVHRAILAGDRETGVTIMRVVEALDSGPMLAVARRPIDEAETSAEVETALATLGATLLVDVLDTLAHGPVREEPQDASRATYAPRLTKADSPVDWSRTARAIHDQIRGLHPWPLAETWLRKERVILRRAAVADGAPSNGEVPGTVLTARGEDFVVAASDGAIRLIDIQREGKRPMSARDFLAGHPVTPGERFSTQP